jgi:cbb3-type cytochrome oxidase subunit 3
MEQTAPPGPDPLTRLALENLNDIVLPQPVSWLPQTWGWLALALILLALIAWALWRRHQRYLADRYRREALAELDRIEATLGTADTRDRAIAGIAELLKRVALHAWPRATTASLSGPAWLAFLKQHDGDALSAGPASCFLDDLEYHADGDLAEGDVRQFAEAARRWIERHHVSA